jgi:hypothetical protein
VREAFGNVADALTHKTVIAGRVPHAALYTHWLLRRPGHRARRRVTALLNRSS